MPGARKSVVLLTFLLLLATALMLAGDKKSKPKGRAQSPSSAPAQMDENKRILHALNRFTFGPTPGEAGQVKAMGLDNWFELQLHPEKIDDSALDARLAPFRTLKMSPRELVMNFPPPQLIRQIENGRMGVPSDPARKAIYESRLAQYEQRQQNKAANSNTAANASQADQPEMAAGDLQRQQASMYADLDADQLLAMPPDQRYQNILKMSPEERLALGRKMRGMRSMQLIDGMKPEQRETIEAIMNPQLVVGGELSQAKLLRAIYSNRSLKR